MKASPSSPSNKSRTDGIVKSIHSSIINLHQLGYNLAVNISALLAAKKIVYGYATRKKKEWLIRHTYQFPGVKKEFHG